MDKDPLFFNLYPGQALFVTAEKRYLFVRVNNLLLVRQVTSAFFCFFVA